MGLTDFDILLRSLAAYMAGAASLAYTGTPRAVWAHAAVDRDAAAVYSVLRQFGGAVPWVPVAEAEVQVRTTALNGNVTGAFAQATALFGSLFDASGRPLRNAMILTSATPGAGIRLNAADCRQPPGFVDFDDRGRANVVFNFTVKAVPV